jgi:alkanesulfonate monooxygenase SsuD/methylene tetrahydromethanopterin reductase-like flavin-dependent oxidoreductase (luciferase family)
MFQWISPNYEYRYVNIWPRPLQTPHPPIYIPGAGSTETMKFCAQHRYTYMSVYAPARVVGMWFDGYRKAAEDLGYFPEPGKLALSVPIYVAATDEQAHREAEQHIMWLFRRGLKQSAEMVIPPGYMSLSSLRGMLMSGRKPFTDASYEELVSEGYVVVGSPDTVTNRLGELQDQLGFGQLIGLFAIGDMPHERVIANLDLFVSGVMPVIRSLGVSPAGTAR